MTSQRWQWPPEIPRLSIQPVSQHCEYQSRRQPLTLFLVTIPGWSFVLFVVCNHACLCLHLAWVGSGVGGLTGWPMRLNRRWMSLARAGLHRGRQAVLEPAHWKQRGDWAGGALNPTHTTASPCMRFDNLTTTGLQGRGFDSIYLSKRRQGHILHLPAIDWDLRS